MNKSLTCARQNSVSTIVTTFANEQLDLRKMRFVKITPNQIIQDIDQQGPGAIGNLCDRRYISQMLELLGRARLLENELDGWGLLSKADGTLTTFCLVDINEQDLKAIKIELLCSDMERKFGQGALLLALVLAFYVQRGYSHALLQIATRDPEQAERLYVFYGRFGFFQQEQDATTLFNNDMLSALLQPELHDFLTYHRLWNIVPLNLTQQPLDIARSPIVRRDVRSTTMTKKRPRGYDRQRESMVERKKKNSLLKYRRSGDQQCNDF